MGASQAPGAMMALAAPLGHLAVLVPEALKDCRARRVNEGPLESMWWAPRGPLGPLEREGSRGVRDPWAPAVRRERPR